MLNIEWHEKEIRKIGLNNIGILNGNLVSCGKIHCSECEFGDGDLCEFGEGGECEERILDWLLEEYEEPETGQDENIDWTKVPVDTEVLVRNKKDEGWEKAFFTVYIPRAMDNKYMAFGLQEKQYDACFVRAWRYCKLANKEDIEKYRRKNGGNNML